MRHSPEKRQHFQLGLRLLGLCGFLLISGCGGDGSPTPSPAADSSGTTIRAMAAAATGGYNWSSVSWGGGGFVTGIVYHPNVQGLSYVRTDVGGAYRRDPGSSKWTPLNDGLNRDDAQLMGVLSLAVDPNDSQKLYLATGSYLPSWGRTAAILRSSDRGNTWQRTELSIRLGGNTDGRGNGERLQVDPHLGSVLFLGTNQDGLYKSTNSGVSWSKVSSFSPSATTFVLFQKNIGSNGSASPNLWVGVASTSGTNFYRSTDGGSSWSAVPNQPTGLMPVAAAYDGWGNVYITYCNVLGPSGITSGAVYKYTIASNSWTNITPAASTSSIQFGYGGVSVSVQNPNIVMVSTLDRWATGDDVYRSTNGGSSWTGLNAISTHSAPNNPWLTAYHGGSLSGKMGGWITDVSIDPYDSNSVMYNTGYGLWESKNATNSSVSWAFNVSGIEETAVNTVISPPSNASLFMTQGDVGGARYNTSFTDGSGYFPNPTTNNFGIDYAQYYTPFVVRTVASGNTAFLSWDNGVTWYQSGSSPVASGSDAGKIAVSASGSSLVWVPGGQGAYYSTNNGTNWTASSGYPTTGGISGGGYYAPIADRQTDGYYYTYNFGNGSILQSANGGQTFTTIYTGLDTLPTYASQSQLITVPGVRRDLWLGTPNGLWHIAGASASPSKISNVQAAYAVGYGAAASGKTYPAIYIFGKMNNTYGIYQSIDGGANWTRINDDQHQYNAINAISGDPRVFGRVYIAAGGRGVIVGNPN